MFVRILSAHRLQSGALLLLLSLAAAALLAFPQAAAAGVNRGLSLCVTVLIPSLFPFLILSNFLSISGLCDAVGRRLERVTMALFGLPGCCAAGILLSFVGGYPTGACTVAALCRQGDLSHEQGRRMLCFCTCAGPAFLISAVGAGMFGSARYGALLYAAHLAAALVMGIGQRLLCPRPQGLTAARLPAPPPAPAAALAESVRSGCRSLFYLCGFAVAFCTLISLLDACRITDLLTALLSPGRPAPPALRGAIGGLLEITGGCLAVAAGGTPEPLLLGFLLGFGSLSIHCQVSAWLHDMPAVRRGFFRARLLHAALGGLFTLWLTRLFPAPLHVLQAADGTPVRLFTVSAAASACLLMMFALFLLGAARSAAKK